MKANADFRNRAGLDTYIERRDDGKCCEWCSKLAGRYRYPDGAPRDVFRRHDNCGCTVEYVCSKGRQNVWSKRWASEPKKIEYSKLTVLTPKEAEELEKRLTNERKSGIIKPEEVRQLALENQRYGRNKDTLVNKTYIDGGEYKRKFDNATDNPNVNKALYDCAKRALKHRSGTALEDMYWLDAETGKIVFAVTDSTDDRAIIYTDKLRKAIKGRESMITIHTHPSSMPPSIDDFNSSYKNGYKEGFIACHNGKVFRYSSEQEVSKTLYNLYINEFMDNGLNEYDAQLKALYKIKENHAISFSEVI